MSCLLNLLPASETGRLEVGAVCDMMLSMMVVVMMIVRALFVPGVFLSFLHIQSNYTPLQPYS